MEKYDEDLFDLFCAVFACLPLAHVVSEKVFVVHGGLSWKNFTMEDIMDIDRSGVRECSLFSPVFLIVILNFLCFLL